MHHIAQLFFLSAEIHITAVDRFYSKSMMDGYRRRLASSFRFSFPFYDVASALSLPLPFTLEGGASNEDVIQALFTTNDPESLFTKKRWLTV